MSTEGRPRSSSGTTGAGGQRMTIRNSNLSPRRSSILSTTSSKRQSIQATATLDQISLTPICVTCFGDFILAHLISTSKTNYLAIWGPECHLCESKELTIETAKFCRALPSRSLNSLSLRVLFHGESVKFIIHGASNDHIERWVLNAYGEVMETATKNLETPIELFSIDPSGGIMISYEENFIILRNEDLRVFHSIKFGKEIPTNSLIIPQANTNKLHLVACYESGLILGWEIPSPLGNINPELFALFSQPIFQLKLSSKSPICGLVEVLNTDRLHHRRFCVGSRAGQLWMIEWSTRDLTVCSEVKHVDLKKSLRYQRPPSKTQATTAAPPRNSKTPSREEKTPSSSAAPAMIADISVLSMCSCPDISFESYSPPGDRPDGVTLEQWRHFQTNALAGASKFALHFNYKPTICLLTSLGAPVLVDVETFRILPPIAGANATSAEEPRINGVISSAISCLNVLSQHVSSQEGNEDNEDDDESSDDSTGEDHKRRGSRGASPLLSPTKTMIRKTLVSPLRMGSPGRDSVAATDRSSFLSPMRRGSVQSRNSLRRGSRTQPAQLLADYRALTNLRKTLANKFGSLTTVFAFSVLLGGFDRKLMIRPILTATIPPVASATASPSKQRLEKSNETVGLGVGTGRHVTSDSPEDAQARVEVAKLPLWALTLKEQGSTESLPERSQMSNPSATDQSSVESTLPFSFFHQRFFQPSLLTDRSPLASTNTGNGEGGNRQQQQQQPQTSRSKTPTKVQIRGNWERPVRSNKGEIIDQPVTFHSRIKSSGYGVADVSGNRWKQKKQINATSSSSSYRSKSAPRNHHSGTTDRTTIASRLRMYPRDCGPLIQIQEYNNYPPPVSNIHQVPLMKLNFSGDGTMIGVVSAGNDVGTLRTPLGKYKGDGLFYLGHDAQVNSVEFAHKSDLLISSSADATARIWKTGRVDSAVVVFSHKRHHPVKIGTTPSSSSSGRRQQGTGTGSGTQSRNTPFSGAILSASFYYLDKFALLTSKTSVRMYSYDLEDLEQENDLKRLQATGKYKLVHEWSYDTAQSLTATACLNSVESPTILTSSSDRKVLILDAISGKISRIVESNHDRSIHCIALPQPSVHVSLPQSHYNIFATSSTDNVISLWDIRSPSIIFRFTEHVNRREKVQCAFSPCLRYLTTGSEDRSIRIIDIQSGGRQIHKLTSGSQRDVVTSVAYHPIHPQLISGSYDGSIRCFTSSDS